MGHGSTIYDGPNLGSYVYIIRSENDAYKIQQEKLQPHPRSIGAVSSISTSVMSVRHGCARHVQIFGCHRCVLVPLSSSIYKNYSNLIQLMPIQSSWKCLVWWLDETVYGDHMGCKTNWVRFEWEIN